MQVLKTILIAGVAIACAGAAYTQGLPLEEACKGTSNDHAHPCREYKFELADKELNAVYDATILHMQTLDRIYSVDVYENTLRDAQRAWIAGRDPTCQMEGLIYRGGSGFGQVTWLCRTRITRERIEYLKTQSERLR